MADRSPCARRVGRVSTSAAPWRRHTRGICSQGRTTRRAWLRPLRRPPSTGDGTPLRTGSTGARAHRPWHPCLCLSPRRLPRPPRPAARPWCSGYTSRRARTVRTANRGCATWVRAASSCGGTNRGTKHARTSSSAHKGPCCRSQSTPPPSARCAKQRCERASTSDKPRTRSAPRAPPRLPPPWPPAYPWPIDAN